MDYPIYLTHNQGSAYGSGAYPWYRVIAVRSFVTRRDPPKEVYTDCGTCFLGASRELKEEIKQRNDVLGRSIGYHLQMPIRDGSSSLLLTHIISEAYLKDTSAL